MPIGEDNIKHCLCCKKKVISYELFFVCSKCVNKGHTGWLSCSVCSKEKKTKDTDIK